MAASTLRLSNTYLGAQFRRLRTKLGAPVAIKAMAAKLARLVYRMLRYGMQFIDRGAEFYDAQHRKLQINYLKRKPPISDSKSSKLQQRSFWREFNDTSQPVQ
jgi:transposase